MAYDKTLTAEGWVVGDVVERGVQLVMTSASFKLF